MVIALWLDYNPMVKLVLTKIKKYMATMDRNKPDATVFELFQNTVVIYICLAVLESSRMKLDEHTGGKRVLPNYENFVVPSFFKWLEDETDFTAPSWLTPENMGCSTLGSGDRKLYEDGSIIWRRYVAAERDISDAYNAAYEEAKYGKPWGYSFRGTPRSDAEIEQDFEYLLDLLWEAHCDPERKLHVVDATTEANETQDGGGGEGESPATATEESPGARKENVRKRRGRPPSSSSSTKKKVKIPERPEHWIPAYLLAFCLYGRPNLKRGADEFIAKTGSWRPRKWVMRVARKEKRERNKMQRLS